LDIGCGRGRVAAHFCKETGSSVYGINIDTVQIGNAIQNAKEKGLSNKLNFQIRNYNDPLPFEDNFFDAVYQIQVFTYAKDYDKLFAEIYRVMKPGAKLTMLDWVALDKFDKDNKYHQELFKKTKILIGAVRTPTPKEYCDHFENVGFKVLEHREASVIENQADLIAKADYYFTTAQFIINLLVTIKILPQHMKTLFDRFTKYADCFVESNRLGLFTSSYQFTVQKPLY